MKNCILLIFLLLMIYSFSRENLGLIQNSTDTINENDEEKYDSEKLYNVKEYIDYYVKTHKFKNTETLEKEEFMLLFIYVLQRGALKVEPDTTKIRKLDEKMLEKHGNPAKINDLYKYFNIMELTLTYSELFNPEL